jgi:hypothetical protein
VPGRGLRIAAGELDPAQQVMGVAVRRVEGERSLRQCLGRAGRAGHVEAPGAVGEAGSVRFKRLADRPELRQRLVAQAGLERDAAQAGALDEELGTAARGPEAHALPGARQRLVQLAAPPVGLGQAPRQPGAVVRAQRGRVDVRLAAQHHVGPAAGPHQRVRRQRRHAHLLREVGVEA